MPCRLKVQIAGIVTKPQFLQDVEPSFIDAEARRTETCDIGMKKLLHLCFGLQDIPAELLCGNGHGRDVRTAVQRKGMPVGDAGSQAVGDLRSETSQGKQGAFDAMSIQYSDVFVQAVHVIFVDLDSAGHDALRIRKGFHIHGKDGIFFLLHSMIVPKKGFCLSERNRMIRTEGSGKFFRRLKLYHRNRINALNSLQKNDQKTKK